MDINSILIKICNDFNLGNIIHSPEKMSGVFLHFVYKIKTHKCEYVIKILNPKIMERETALNNFEKANSLEKLLKQNQINAVYYNIFDSVVLGDNKYYFYVYDCFNGESIFDEKMTKNHCEKIGETLAKIHNIKIFNTPCDLPAFKYNWDYYINELKNKDKQIYLKLKRCKNVLNFLCENYNQNLQYLPQIQTICHNDLDPKNVLWNNDGFALIDLECLAYFNPYLELIEVFLQWSGINSLKLNKQCFMAVKMAYLKHTKLNLDFDWEVIYHCNINMINWLEYNIKKYLENQFTNNKEFVKTKQEISKTIDKIKFYYKNKNKILKLIK